MASFVSLENTLFATCLALGVALIVACVHIASLTHRADLYKRRIDFLDASLNQSCKNEKPLQQRMCDLPRMCGLPSAYHYKANYKVQRGDELILKASARVAIPDLSQNGSTLRARRLLLVSIRTP